MRAGNRIRSYDFEPVVGRGECYLEGTIVRVADGFVFFMVDREVWDGQPVQGNRIGYETSAPLQGVGIVFGEFDGRLQVLHS